MEWIKIKTIPFSILAFALAAKAAGAEKWGVLFSLFGAFCGAG